MTIKERAYQAVGHPLPKKGEMHVPIMLKLEERTFVNGYIKGYRDSINKACEWLKNNINIGGENTCSDIILKDFRKAMEE